MKKLIICLVLISSIFLFNRYLLNVDSYNIDNVLQYDLLEENIDGVNVLLKNIEKKELSSKKIENDIEQKLSDVLKGMKFLDRVKAFVYFNYTYKKQEHQAINEEEYKDYIKKLNKKDLNMFVKFLKEEMGIYEGN